MPDRHQHIANFVQRSPIFRPVVVWPQTVPPFRRLPYPTARQMADELLADSEFEALRLASWMRSPNGELIAEAVSLVIPSAFQPEYELAVEALQLAAEMQYEEGRPKRLAGVLALTGASILGVSVLAPAVRQAT
ncbi:MAG TPA: hypothetical protein VFP23_10440 [Solirubrobacterales bacterium]|nr:hypothetical protein [Solirubrobacterales bacterium]